MLALTRRDLVFPRDLHFDQPALYVRVKDPKTARFARRQRSRVDDVSVIRVAEAVFGRITLDEHLYLGTVHTFRREWNEIMHCLGVPCRQSERGATPGVLRGSGATFFYSCTEDLELGRLAWQVVPSEDLGILLAGSRVAHVNPRASSLVPRQIFCRCQMQLRL